MTVETRRAVIEMLMAAIAGRGPDCSAIVDNDGLSLGFCRLTITGDTGAVQPVRCHHVTSAVNGEIYNYRSLWQQIPRELAAVTRLDSDCAVVAPLAVERGEGFLDLLDGIFAGVVFDQRHNQLMLFRDHLGIKPLHYLRLRNGVAFASTASALAMLTRREIHDDAFRTYLADGYVAGNATLIKGVQKVPAGSLVKFTSPTVKPHIRQWFNTRSEPTDQPLRSLVIEAVRSEIPNHGPTVTTLSGGIDSTLITLLAAREQANPIALTVSYADAPADRDLAVAQQVAKEHNIRHQIVDVSANDYLEEVAGDWRFDVPIADPNAIALNRLCQRANEIGSRVLLAGEGADEVFCGYPYYLDVAGSSMAHFWASWRFTSMTDHHDRDFVHILTGRRTGRPFRVAAMHPLRLAQTKDIKNWLEPNLLEKADRFGMANHVEIRPPFLRKSLVRYGLALSPGAKVDSVTGLGKVALRDSFADILPGYVLRRPKQGFPCPLSEWLRSSLGQRLQDEANSPVDNHWDPARERTLWTEHREGRQDWGQQLWRLAVLRAWWRSISKPYAGGVNIHQLASQR